MDTPDIAELALDFGRRADISARSVLVTIFGDAIVPAGGEIWLGDLIDMCRPFGFSDRLVRTSMYRLTTEAWFETERVGRRSQYRLTATAREEFGAAEERIYRLPEVDWDGQWTMVFLGPAGADRQGRRELEATLRWRGYASLSPGVMAIPRAEVDVASRLIERSTVETAPVATATFVDLEPLVSSDGFAVSFGLDEAAIRYRDFIDRYGWTSTLSAASITDRDAFLARTMLAHDLRRPRLADPDLPKQVVPDDWPAPAAVDLAGAGYRRLIEPADRWIATFPELEAPDTASLGRFSQRPRASR